MGSGTSGSEDDTEGGRGAGIAGGGPRCGCARSWAGGSGACVGEVHARVLRWTRPHRFAVLSL
eukprot:10881924-Alexandrium_andersonii.AAC.1